MIKILILSSTSIVSGAEYILSDYIKNTGYKKSFIILHSDNENINKFYTKLNIKCYKCRFLNPVGAEKTKNIFLIIKKFIYFLFSFFCFMRVIKNNNINTVFGNNTGDVVFSIYSYFFKKRHINYIQDIIDRKSLLAFSIKIFDRFIFKYVTVSNAVKASLINLGLKASKIEIIYNGLEIKDNFKNKKLNKRLIFGFVGYIDDVKNPLEFVDFIKMASDNGVLCNAKMVIGKVINKTLYENLIRKIKYVGILIEIFKSLPREKMGLFYKKIDFLVITSKKEALPTVILEAFNNAVPVIGKKTGGISEIIKNNYNGYLYDTPKDFKSIINKIKKLNNYRYNIMCRNSFETVKKEFNLKQKIVKLNNILFKV